MSGNPSQFFLNLPFGENMVDQKAATPAYESPYKFNGKELDEGTGMYYYGARYYDPRISVWMSVDPLAEKYNSFTPYNYCFNNPVCILDPNGADTLIFGSNNRYKTYKTGGENIGMKEGKNGFYFRFADPVHDPEEIKQNPNQAKLEIMGRRRIQEALSKAGVYLKQNQGLIAGSKYLLKESNAATGGGEGKLDFTGTGKYDAFYHTFYVTNTKADGYVAHNGFNFGNFLWGAGADALGIPIEMAIIGAHYHNYFDFKTKGTFDSPDDQYSIRVGYNWSYNPQTLRNEILLLGTFKALTPF